MSDTEHLAPWEEVMGKPGTYCAYCGAEFPVDDDATLVSNHIATCELHPMRETERQLTQTLARNMQLKEVVDYLLRIPARGGLSEQSLRWIQEWAANLIQGVPHADD